MKKLMWVLATLGLGLPLLNASLVRAQDNLPILEQPTAASATELTQLQTRKASSDFDFLFLPAGAGGEELSNNPVGWGYSSTELTPVSSSTNTVSTLKLLPTYAIVEPNRAIETQTDPQRLTILTPTRPVQR
ncbi:MAG: hypothetical protein ACKO7W_00980 [Elainella sp.]